ncbi:hypothetical protein B0T24DRAFT_84440 [Lasiosphaeria ovina]|uniref:Uncharacterized protein n=1 Tax=Lasiosphaeria ovina TaxID=92902 RepID=A0AAE0TYT2_9PEZI|nr:hypothetical protein B0T24DRAFT_84440 [Lasiosphaeria ovina]
MMTRLHFGKVEALFIFSCPLPPTALGLFFGSFLLPWPAPLDHASSDLLSTAPLHAAMDHGAMLGMSAGFPTIVLCLGSNFILCSTPWLPEQRSRARCSKHEGTRTMLRGPDCSSPEESRQIDSHHCGNLGRPRPVAFETA